MLCVYAVVHVAVYMKSDSSHTKNLFLPEEDLLQFEGKYGGSLSPSSLRVWFRVTFMLITEISCIKKYFNAKMNPILEF